MQLPKERCNQQWGLTVTQFITGDPKELSSFQITSSSLGHEVCFPIRKN